MSFIYSWSLVYFILNKKYNDINLTSKKNSTNSDNKEVLTKDELMLKYLLDNLEEQKRVKIKEGNSLE